MRLDSETLRTPQNFVSQIEVSIFLFRNCRCSVTDWNAIFHKMSKLTQAGFNLAILADILKFARYFGCGITSPRKRLYLAAQKNNYASSNTVGIDLLNFHCKVSPGVHGFATPPG